MPNWYDIQEFEEPRYVIFRNILFLYTFFYFATLTSLKYRSLIKHSKQYELSEEFKFNKPQRLYLPFHFKFPRWFCWWNLWKSCLGVFTFKTFCKEISMKYSKDLHAKILIENDLRTQYVVWKARPWCIIEGTIEWCDIIVLLVEWIWH